jgi:hypothetical protein
MAVLSADSVSAWSTFATLFVTFLVGVAAAAVAWQSRNVAAASIVPLLHVRENIMKDKLNCTIVNWGLGPAVVQGMQVTYPPVPCILGAAVEFGKTLLEQEGSMNSGSSHSAAAHVSLV